MAGMKNVNGFLVARYIVFGLFIICNAVTCSVAVWNNSLVHSTLPSQIDIYLIFLGAFSLLSIFTLIFIELLCINSVTTRVWFEFVWVTLLWVMELAGGAALIAIDSTLPCSQQGSGHLDALCTSNRVLLAFTWISTIILLIHLLTLVFIVASRHHEAPKIWVSDIRALRATAASWQSSSSTANSPLSTRFKRHASIEIYTPQPMRSQPAGVSFHHHRGLSAEYEIEPFRPVFVGPEQMDVPHPPNLREAAPLPPSAAPPIIPTLMKPGPALYKDMGNMRSQSLSLPEPPPGLVSSITYSSSAALPSRSMPSQNAFSAPSPLGEWPRRDIMQQPVKTRPKPSAFQFPKRHTVAERTSVAIDTATQPRPRRPSGPRLRVPSTDDRHRPTPLNLFGLSNYEPRTPGSNV